jgi:hypothetical protein
MPLTKLQFRPGINREITSYSNEGGWFDCDKVRFRYGFPEKIGGWLRLSATTFLGTCRALHPWVALDGSRYLGVGTHLKYYINEGGGYSDITPIRDTTAAGDVTFVAAANTLSAGISAVQTIIPLTSSTGFPPSGLIQIGSEQIRYATVTGNDLEGVTRGVNGTIPAAHLSAAAVDCATLTVSDTGHGALDNDFVTFSGAVSLGSQITAAILNQEYQIVSIVDVDSYLIEARAVASIPSITTSGGLAPTPVFADSSDSGTGGASVVGAYQINTGLDTTITGNGWGAGTWGRSTWGSGASLLVSGSQLRIWSHDNFGEDLLYNVRDGGIFYWDKSSGTTARGVALSSLGGASSTPTIAKQVMVSDRDRHILAFGCDSEASPGVQDPLLIRFSSQESLTDWAATATNTAGDLRLGSGSQIITAAETRQQILVFTDTSLYAMQYLGPPFTFGVQLISENITIGGPLTAMAVDDQVYWMGLSEFYVYNGAVQRLPCTVRDYVFEDMNLAQMEKVTAGLNSENSEIWWFYPSAASTENDRYVVYNYMEQAWYYGTLARTAWLDRGIEEFPIAAAPDHYLYNHEFGFDDGSTSPASAIAAFVSSSPMDLGDGQQFTFVRRLLPDVNFRNSSAPVPGLDITTRVRNSTNASFLSTTTSAVGPTTDQIHLRLRGRQFSVVVESDETGVAWRLGSLRYDLQPDGMR